MIAASGGYPGALAAKPATTMIPIASIDDPPVAFSQWN